MTPREIIRRLCLQPHPEGGHYREFHRSSVDLGTPPGYPGARRALTVIWFLLQEGEFSAIHRVRGEEVWTHLEGAPMELWILEERLQHRHLGPVGVGDTVPTLVVPPGAWQAAQPVGGWSLVTCAVAPGFEFADFELPDRLVLERALPAHRDWVRRFTR